MITVDGWLSGNLYTVQSDAITSALKATSTFIVLPYLSHFLFLHLCLLDHFLQNFNLLLT